MRTVVRPLRRLRVSGDCEDSGTGARAEGRGVQRLLWTTHATVVETGLGADRNGSNVSATVRRATLDATSPRECVVFGPSVVGRCAVASCDQRQTRRVQQKHGRGRVWVSEACGRRLGEDWVRPRPAAVSVGSWAQSFSQCDAVGFGKHACT